MPDPILSRTCAQCKHWHRQPLQGLDLSQVRGECRHSPPSATSLPERNGIMVLVNYPSLPMNYPACGQFVQRIQEPEELTLLGKTGIT